MNRKLCLFVLPFMVSATFADPLTTQRVLTLPTEEQPLWQAYLSRSQAAAKADQAALDAEVLANHLPQAVIAPSGGDFKLKADPGDAWFATAEAKGLADVVLTYQTPSGGWSKHLGFGKGARKPGVQWSSQNEPGKPAHYVATFDNASTTSEMELLAGVWQATQREDCKAGFIKALNFVLAAQYPNGGWPQVYPLEGAYHDDITFNDDAITHILELLKGITDNEPRYAFLADPQRKQAADALARGIRCVVQTQVEMNGSKTAWCAQHDPLTLLPAAARKMEPAALSGLESAHVLKFLMTLRRPTPDVVDTINSGMSWFEGAKITGEEKTNAEGQKIFIPGTAGLDTRWARFYDLKTNKPIFPGRDGVLYDTLEALAAKNELGYDYYTSQPGSVITNGQKKWRKMLASPAAK